MRKNGSKVFTFHLKLQTLILVDYDKLRTNMISKATTKKTIQNDTIKNTMNKS